MSTQPIEPIQFPKNDLPKGHRQKYNKVELTQNMQFALKHLVGCKTAIQAVTPKSFKTALHMLWQHGYAYRHLVTGHGVWYSPTLEAHDAYDFLNLDFTPTPPTQTATNP